MLSVCVCVFNLLERTKTCSRADSTRYRSQLTIMNYSLCAVYSIFYIFFYYKQYQHFFTHCFTVALLRVLFFSLAVAATAAAAAIVVVFFFTFIQSSFLSLTCFFVSFVLFRFRMSSYLLSTQRSHACMCTEHVGWSRFGAYHMCVYLVSVHTNIHA